MLPKDKDGLYLCIFLSIAAICITAIVITALLTGHTSDGS